MTGPKEKKIAYIDPCFGISGDMLLGAFVDLGFGIEALEKVVSGLGIQGLSLKAVKTKKKGIAAVKFDVVVEKRDRKHVRLKDIEAIIETSEASPGAKGLAIKIFQKIAEAEAFVHGTGVREIHFHEVGAVDSIVDILGAAMAFDHFGFDKIVSAPVNTGSGFVKCDHGILPVPPPAVSELLKEIPSFSSGVQRELTTPTGAAILTTVASSFGPLPLMKIQRTGYGAGTADLEDSPNVLRIITGEPVEELKRESVMEVEANIDDMNPEYYEYIMDELFKAGALDVFLTPIIMKKSRPAVKLSILCEEASMGKVHRILFHETSTFGVRQWAVAREKIRRVVKKVETNYGPVNVKIGFPEEGNIRISPEYESCVRAARENGVPLQVIFDAAREAAAKIETFF